MPDVKKSELRIRSRVYDAIGFCHDALALGQTTPQERRVFTIRVRAAIRKLVQASDLINRTRKR